MVEKRDSMRSSSQGEKIELWNEHPDYYRALEATNPVSYTHLTLPTSDLV